MTTIDSIGNIPTIQNGNVVNNQPKVNFRASAQADNPVDSFISEQEKAKKKGCQTEGKVVQWRKGERDVFPPKKKYTSFQIEYNFP